MKRKTSLIAGSLVFFLALTTVTWVLGQTITQLDSSLKFMATNQFGGSYGALTGYMQNLVYTPCPGGGCYTEYVRAFSTTSPSINTNPPLYHDLVDTYFRVLNPADTSNPCKEEDQHICLSYGLKTCKYSDQLYSTHLEFTKGYYNGNNDIYHIAKVRGRYEQNIATYGAAKTFVLWPDVTPSNGQLDRTGYFFRGKRSKTAPNICEDHNFTPIVPDDDDPTS